MWGNKTVRQHLGYAADFCPVCGNARAFALTRVTVPDDRTLVAYERDCVTCSAPMQAELARYTQLLPTVLPIGELVRQTFPQFVQVNQDLLDQERLVREDPSQLSSSQRMNLIMLPFMLVSVKVSQWFARPHLTPGTTFMQRDVMPILARGLRRVQPTERELQATLDRLVQLNEVIGSKLTAAELLAVLKTTSTKNGLRAQ
jgi:hypothetical protein